MNDLSQTTALQQAAPPIQQFEQLYTQYVKKVYSKCLTMTKDASQAQDCTQDIFLKAFDKLNTFNHQSSFSTWLFSIAHHHCLDHIQTSKRRLTESLPSELDVAIDPNNDTEKLDDRLQQLDRLLERLPEEEVTMLRLKYEHKVSIQALSERYQLSASAVKMRLKRSREKLQAMAAWQRALD